MKLIDALKAIREPPSAAEGRVPTVALACGFQPLHLETFLAAHLRRRLGRPVEIRTGLYGDTIGTIEGMLSDPADWAVVAVEWSDFDPRLGWRHAGGWSPAALPDILAGAAAGMERLERVLNRAAQSVPIAVSLPTLPLPPVAYENGAELGSWELQLRLRLAEFACRLGDLPRLRLVSESRLGARSPAGERHDLKSELASGFPYGMAHASVLAELLAANLVPEPAKKGIITDLDDTLWRGLVGEIGVDGVHWHLDSGSHGHGLYQQLLAALAEAGILVAVASKNDPELAAPALGRSDLLLGIDRIFPVEIGWGSKSKAVSRILDRWNIGAQDVVFVDDSPLELAEVQAAHPLITTLQFPSQDSGAADFLVRLRDLFGKREIGSEDSLRLDSLRAGAAFRREQSEDENGDFLAGIDGVVEFALESDPDRKRPFELVNKTNQWNLNGRRWSEAEWLRRIGEEHEFVLSASYRDKFGPLGLIAVLAGSHSGGTIRLDTWVMSCRAFARRIEHACLLRLFDLFEADRMLFDFAPTERNRPIRQMLEPLGALEQPLSRQDFERSCPALHHSIEGPA